MSINDTVIGKTIGYAVVNENALGHRFNLPSGRCLGILASSLIRGGPNWIDGHIQLSTADVVRPATRKDFDDYRVMIPPDFSEGK